jgi:hypothetical protein
VWHKNPIGVRRHAKHIAHRHHGKPGRRIKLRKSKSRDKLKEGSLLKFPFGYFNHLKSFAYFQFPQKDLHSLYSKRRANEGGLSALGRFSPFKRVAASLAMSRPLLMMMRMDEGNGKMMKPTNRHTVKP